VRVTAYYDQFADEIARIVQADSELTATVIENLVLGYRFVLALLNVSEQRSTIRVSLALYNSATEVFERIRAQSDNDDLIAALNDVQSQLSRLVNLTPEEALRVISELE
jgi:selenocysteine lyase/cysteine desulfurase